jgi:RHS repeat-associated protein
VRQWRAPQAGTIQITGSVADAAPDGGDGVVIKITKGTQILWQQTVANGNTTGLTYNLTTTVQSGDQISFSINRNWDSTWDSTSFNPTITFTSGSVSAGQIYWLITDHLGTPRMTLDQTGSLASMKRHDYLPFGEELFAGVGSRTTPLGYSVADGVRQQFTSKERDNETGLDYFGARYYGSTTGRFTSPDPMLSSGRPIYPQSWNRYSYVINHPLSLVDPNGLDWGYSEWIDNNGVHVTSYHYFTGQIGSYGGHDYKPVNFGGDATRTLDLYDGRTVTISNNPDVLGGTYMRDVTPHPHAEPEPVLPPSWMDKVPVLNNTRSFLFHYTTHNFEAALGDFGLLTFELGTANLGASATAAKSFATGSGEAIFYSGGKAALEAATEAAASEGGKTVAMTFGGKVLTQITKPLPERAQTMVWNWGSKHFANGANGSVRAFLREPLRTNSTWAQVEYPILRVNPFARIVQR